MKMTLGIILTAVGLLITALGIFQITTAKQTETALAEAIQQPEAPKPQATETPAEEESDSKLKGRLFEEYVVSQFSRKYFEIMEWRGDKSTQDGRYATANQYPDLELKFSLRGKEHSFAVECKWRKSTAMPIKWTYQEQLERYKDFQKSKGIPVFVTLGLGGEPEKPQYVYIMPLSEVNTISLSAEQLRPYLKNDGKTFFFDAEKGSLR